jgi:hypothetical protein
MGKIITRLAGFGDAFAQMVGASFAIGVSDGHFLLLTTAHFETRKARMGITKSTKFVPRRTRQGQSVHS